MPPFIGFGHLLHARDWQFFDTPQHTAGTARTAKVHREPLAFGFSEGNDTGGCGRVVGQERGRHRVIGISEQGIERGLEAVAAKQGFPHHRRNLEAGAHRRAGAATYHVDTKLQPAQALLVGLWKLAKKLFDQGKAPRLEGRWIIFGQTRPFVKIEREAKIGRWLHLSGPVTFDD